MKRSVAVALALALGACATRPPLPPECTGELVPINAPRTAPGKAGNG